MISANDPVKKYEDMLHLSRPISKRHPPMPREKRGAQFAPFAALTGHEAALRETARLTEERRELSEDEKEVLDCKLYFLRAHASEHPPLSIWHFCPDETKDGGSYRRTNGRLKKIDEDRHIIILEEGQEISTSDIVALESSVLPDIDFPL